MDGDWCSLEELGTLSQLRSLRLVGLQNVSAASFARKARLGEKVYLSMLCLHCRSGMGYDGLMTEIVSEEDQRVIQEVFNELSPPPCVEVICIRGYSGRLLPKWMMSTSAVLLKSLTTLKLHDLAFCTQLPDGMCQLPCLELLEVTCASAIKCVGSEFAQPYDHRHHATSSQASAAFPRLHNMVLERMEQWEEWEWEWEEEVQAMPVLEELQIEGCKLRCIPPGLSFHATSLKKLTIHECKGLQSLENFASVIKLELYDVPYLTTISNFPKLQKLEIFSCKKLESLREMSALQRLVLVYYGEKRLPLYLEAVNPNHLLLDDCTPELLASMAAGDCGYEWDKFSHIHHVEGYADDRAIEKGLYLIYTTRSGLETNIVPEEWLEYEELFLRSPWVK